MKKELASLALFAALIYGATEYTRPETAPGKALHNTIDPALSRAIKRVQRLPFIRLLDWDGVNYYQPRPTLQRLEVVNPAATGYTPEELSEIYSSH